MSSSAKAEAILALHRFGMGPRPGSIAAIESDRPLYDVLMETPEIAGPLGADTLKALTDPANYLGAAQAMVDRVLKGR